MISHALAYHPHVYHTLLPALLPSPLPYSSAPQVDVCERVVKTLQLQCNAEPSVLVSMMGYGLLPALYATLARFKQHDNVLANVYGTSFNIL